VTITVNYQLVGVGHGTREKIRAGMIQVLAALPGRCHVQFIGDQANDVWEMRVSATGVEASEYLDAALGQHEPEFIAAAVKRIVTR